MNSPPDASSNGTAMQAKVLYDYDAADMKELSLCADEVKQSYFSLFIDSALSFTFTFICKNYQKGAVVIVTNIL